MPYNFPKVGNHRLGARFAGERFFPAPFQAAAALPRRPKPPGPYARVRALGNRCASLGGAASEPAGAQLTPGGEVPGLSPGGTGTVLRRGLLPDKRDKNKWRANRAGRF